MSCPILRNDIDELETQLSFTIEIAKDQFIFFQSLTLINEYDKIQVNDDDCLEDICLINNISQSIQSGKVDLSSMNKLIQNVQDKTQLIWRVHMLNPQSYYNDCLQAFGFIIPFIIDKRQRKFVSSQESNSIVNGIKNHSHTNQENVFSPSIDLKSAVNRQIPFIKKMNKIFKDYINNKNHDNDNSNNDDCGIDIVYNGCSIEEILHTCLLRYCAFLILNKQKHKLLTNKYESAYRYPIFLIPRLDIDLLWHSHQLNPVSYHNISRKLFGVDIFNHNDNINENTLNFNARKTETFWNNTYKHFNSTKYKCISLYTNDTFIYQSDNEKQLTEEKKDNNIQKQKETDLELKNNVNIIESLHQEYVRCPSVNCNCNCHCNCDCNYQQWSGAWCLFVSVIPVLIVIIGFCATMLVYHYMGIDSKVNLVYILIPMVGSQMLSIIVMKFAFGYIDFQQTKWRNEGIFCNSLCGYVGGTNANRSLLLYCIIPTICGIIGAIVSYNIINTRAFIAIDILLRIFYISLLGEVMIVTSTFMWYRLFHNDDECSINIACAICCKFVFLVWVVQFYFSKVVYAMIPYIVAPQAIFGSPYILVWCIFDFLSANFVLIVVCATLSCSDPVHSSTDCGGGG